MKILLWGIPPWAKTAYGKNFLNIGIRLKDAGHDVSIFAFSGNRWGVTPYPTLLCSKCGFILPGAFNEPESCPKCNGKWKVYVLNVYPNGADDYGNTWLPRWQRFLNSDLIIFHYDVWPLGTAFRNTDLPIAWLIPIDHAPVPPPVKEALEGQEKVISYSRFGQKELERAGINSTYIPHAYDEKIYTPGDMKEARRSLSFPEDAFILNSVGSNKGPRKNLGNLMVAWRKFLDQVPEAWKDAFLYLHCNVSRGVDNPLGYELPQIWNGLGIAERIKYIHPIYYEAYGFTEDEMANVYRSANWSILCSMGEGFGMPLMESLACGTPCIFGNYSSMPEVVGPGGLPVEAKERIPFELSSSFQWIPSTEQITERIVEAYRDWQNGGKMRDELGRKGRNHVMRKYAYKKVMPMWENFIGGKKGESLEFPARIPKRQGEVDIILITWNGMDLLPNCIDSIYEYTKRPFHLIVVDDQSTDRTKEYIEKLWNERDNITYIRPDTKAKGGSEIMNQGFKLCRNEFIVSMNNDIVVTEGWLEEPMRCMDDPKVGIVGVKFIWPWDDRIQQAGGTFIKIDLPHHIGEGEPKDAHSETREVPWAAGPCVLLRRECLEPGWDECYDSFGGQEDVDLCLRAWSQGWKVIYCGKSMVYHNEGVTVMKMPNFWDMFARNKTMFVSRWRGRPIFQEMAKL